MWKTKYVIIDQRTPILFGETIKHSKFQHDGVTSAGFVNIFFMDGELKAEVYGESSSLELKPSEDDHILIERYILGKL